MEFINGPKAPPETITMTREEFDQVKLDVARCMDYDHFLRKLYPYFHGELNPTEFEMLRRDFSHFMRDHKLI